MKIKLTSLAVSLVLSAFCGSSVFAAPSCVTTACHQALGQLKHPHLPVQEGDCLACHQQKSKEHPIKGGKSFTPTAKGAALCNQCHERKGTKKLVHAPVKEGDCISCHQPHGSSGRFLLAANEDQTEFCLGCHDSALIKHKYMHGPAAVGSCTKCHDPHDSTEKWLQKGPVRSLCLKCHSDFAKALNEAPVVHPPVKNDPCTSCHDPHGSPVASILKKKMPDVCTQCHVEMGKKIASVKVPHKPLQQVGGCSNCHGAHYSKARGLLPGGEMSTCLSCHNTDKLGTPPLRNIQKDLAGKKLLHGPIEKGQCTACHDPHGGAYFRMLKGSYPQELYMAYQEGIYDACLRCHNKKIVSAADTTTETNFRNGSRNLHSVHILGRKGRTCRFCHEPHASTGEKLINKEGTKFGQWNVPINFILTPKGGSCSPGCHRSYKYDRDKPEKYR